MEFIMGGTILFGGNFAPRDWAICGGQLVAISENQALYAILGTTWGGDGRTNFGIPDLRSRIPQGAGDGPGLAPVRIGQKPGVESVSLAIPHLPSHIHAATFTGTGASPGGLTATATVNALDGSGDLNTPGGGYWANSIAGLAATSGGYSSTKDTTMADDAVSVSITGSGGGITGGSVTVAPTGGNLPFSILQPALGIYYILCVQGIFPSRN
ncbi:MAG: phage tail protein [Endozoicomonas sp.]